MEHERVRLPLYGIMSTRFGFVLIALFAMIGMVVGMAPMQLSGDVGKNISANLTDDEAYKVGADQFVPSSFVYVSLHPPFTSSVVMPRGAENQGCGN